MYKHNTEEHLHNHCCVGTVKSITYSEYVSVTLDIQCAMHMHVASPALPHFSTLPHK